MLEFNLGETIACTCSFFFEYVYASGPCTCIEYRPHGAVCCCKYPMATVCVAGPSEAPGLPPLLLLTLELIVDQSDFPDIHVIHPKTFANDIII